MIKNFFNRILQYYYATNKREVLFQSKLRQEIESIKKKEFKKDKKNLIPYGFKIYSQSDEDGIINEIFKRIGTTNKRFLEFGVNSTDNNTTFLLLNGWTGGWLEASNSQVIRIKKKYEVLLKKNKLRIYKKKITAENINKVIKSINFKGVIDLLSIDIDGNEVYLLNKLSQIKPRVIIVEYNAKFPPPIRKCIKYDPKFIWKYDDYYGASLQLLVDNLKKKYALVGCNISGINAFFIKKELLKNKFPKNTSAKFHFQQFRVGLVNLRTSHPESNKWFN
jgi:hypothetical protein